MSRFARSMHSALLSFCISSSTGGSSPSTNAGGMAASSRTFPYPWNVRGPRLFCKCLGFSSDTSCFNSSYSSASGVQSHSLFSSRGPFHSQIWPLPHRRGHSNMFSQLRKACISSHRVIAACFFGSSANHTFTGGSTNLGGNL